jgi:tetratricopeptide (TPR) repeat protein
MKRLLILSVAIFLVSCGSSEKKIVQKEKSILPPGLEDLSNEDFKPKRQVRYDAEADYHIIGDLVQDALKDESLAKVDQGEIEKLDKKIVGASGLCYLGQSQEGLRKLDAIYPKFKGNPSYWNQMGTCYLGMNKIRKAKIFYNKALSLNKKYTPAINNLGVVYLKEGKREKALAAFKQVLKLRSHSKTAKFNMSSLFIKHGLFAKAEGLLNQIARKSGDDKDVLLAMAYTHLYRKNGQRAAAFLSKVPSAHLRTKQFSLALYYAYKLTKNKKSEQIANFLQGQNLTKTERYALNKLRQL